MISISTFWCICFSKIFSFNPISFFMFSNGYIYFYHIINHYPITQALKQNLVLTRTSWLNPSFFFLECSFTVGKPTNFKSEQCCPLVLTSTYLKLTVCHVILLILHENDMHNFKYIFNVQWQKKEQICSVLLNVFLTSKFLILLSQNKLKVSKVKIA